MTLKIRRVLFRFAVLSFIGLPFVGSRTSQADSLSLSRRDHQLHIAASSVLTVSGALLLKRMGVAKAPLLAGIGTFIVGSAKELVFDASPSSGDMTGNLIGSAAGTLFCISVEF